MRLNMAASAWLCGVCGLGLGGAWAQVLPPEAQHHTEQAQVELWSSHAAVAPGQTVTLGLEQRLAAGWHSYWRNPGDAGLPTRIDWALPAGSVIGPLQWPAPERFTVAGVGNYGYSGTVNLWSSWQVPVDWPVGQAIDLAAEVSWMVCQEQCIPQRARLGLRLPVVASAQAARTDRPGPSPAQAVPQPGPATLALEPSTDGAVLLIPAGVWGLAAGITQAGFFPHVSGWLDAAAPQTLVWDGGIGAYRLTLHRAVPPPSGAATLVAGTLVLGEGTQRRAWDVQASWAPPTAALPDSVSLPGAWLWAFLGGLVLNLMPCVLPVLSLKALSLCAHSRSESRRHGWFYTAGVLCSFTVLGLLLGLLKAGGASLGWGFQFQSPVFVAAMAWLMLALGLNLSGVFEFGTSVTGWGSAWAQRAGHGGSFATGALATVVATPCTAPFMGSALGFALTQPLWTGLTVFVSLGLGLATPFLCLSHWPALQRHLPRPGVWMVRFKQVLAFPMYLSCAWLLWVLSQQTGPEALAWVCFGLVAVAWGAWCHGLGQGSGLWGRRAAAANGCLVLVVLVWGALALQPQAQWAQTQVPMAEPYRAERLAALRAEGQPVFLNLTAAWCITCLVNEKTVLSRPEVQDRLRLQGVHYLKGDWTQQDPEITRLLANFGRTGVPLYVYYPPGPDRLPQVLPQILQTEAVIAVLEGDGRAP